MTITHIPLCPTTWCPQRSNPDYHVCIVCDKPAVEHHHVEKRSLAPGRKKDKTNIVILCPTHHREVTTGGYKDEITDSSYLVKNKRGNTIVKKEMPDGVLIARSGAGLAPGLASPDFLYTADDNHSNAPMAPMDLQKHGGSLDAEVSPRQANNGVLPELHGTVGSGEAHVRDGDGLHVVDGRGEGRKNTELPSRKEGDYAAWCARLDRIGSALHSIRGLKSQATWEAGDAALEGERLFGHDAAQDMDRLGLKPKRLANIMWVAERIPESRRRPSLEWGMHELVAALNVEEQDMWLERAESEGWKRGQLREAMHGPKTEKVYVCPECKYEGKLTEFKQCPVIAGSTSVFG